MLRDISCTHAISAMKSISANRARHTHRQTFVMSFSQTTQAAHKSKTHTTAWCCTRSKWPPHLKHSLALQYFSSVNIFAWIIGPSLGWRGMLFYKNIYIITLDAFNWPLPFRSTRRNGQALTRWLVVGLSCVCVCRWWLAVNVSEYLYALWSLRGKRA